MRRLQIAILGAAVLLGTAMVGIADAAKSRSSRLNSTRIPQEMPMQVAAEQQLDVRRQQPESCEHTQAALNERFAEITGGRVSEKPCVILSRPAK